MTKAEQQNVNQLRAKRTVFISNIPPQVTEQKLVEFLEQRSFNPQKALILRHKADDPELGGISRGSGFVELTSPEEAHHLVNMISRWPLEGRVLRAEMTKSGSGISEPRTAGSDLLVKSATSGAKVPANVERVMTPKMIPKEICEAAGFGTAGIGEEQLIVVAARIISLARITNGWFRAILQYPGRANVFDVLGALSQEEMDHLRKLVTF